MVLEDASVRVQKYTVKPKLVPAEGRCDMRFDPLTELVWESDDGEKWCLLVSTEYWSRHIVAVDMLKGCFKWFWYRRNHVPNTGLVPQGGRNMD